MTAAERHFRNAVEEQERVLRAVDDGVTGLQRSPAARDPLGAQMREVGIRSHELQHADTAKSAVSSGADLDDAALRGGG